MRTPRRSRALTGIRRWPHNSRPARIRSRADTGIRRRTADPRCTLPPRSSNRAGSRPPSGSLIARTSHRRTTSRGGTPDHSGTRAADPATRSVRPGRPETRHNRRWTGTRRREHRTHWSIPGRGRNHGRPPVRTAGRSCTRPPGHRTRRTGSPCRSCTRRRTCTIHQCTPRPGRRFRSDGRPRRRRRRRRDTPRARRTRCPADTPRVDGTFRRRTRSPRGIPRSRCSSARRHSGPPRRSCRPGSRGPTNSRPGP